MKISKKILSLLLALMMLLSFGIGAFAEDAATEGTEGGEATTPTTMTVVFNPDNYASIYLQKGAAKTEAGGYNGSNRQLLMYYNTLFSDNSYIYMHSGSILSEYTLPLREALTELGITHHVPYFPSNAKDNGNHPIFYNIGAFSSGLDIKDGSYKGPTTYDGDDGDSEYYLIKAITENYWPISATTSVGYSSTNWASQVAATFKGSSETTGIRTKTVSATALEKIKADKTSPVITFATGRATSGNSKGAYGLKAADKIPSLTATYSTDGLLNIINAASADEIQEIIDDLGTIGALASTTAGYTGYSTLIAIAKDYVNSEIYKVIANGGFASLDAFYVLYDEKVAFAQANGTLITINSVKSEAELKAMVEELGEAGSLEASESGYTGYTNLAGIMKNKVVKGLYETISEGGYESVEAFLAKYDTYVAEAAELSSEDAVTAELSPENYVAIHLTDEGYHGYARKEAAYYNTPYTENAKFYSESGSFISSYKVLLKDALLSMAVNYSVNTAGQMSNGHVPVFYDLNKFEFEANPDVYEMIVESTEGETTTPEDTTTEDTTTDTPTTEDTTTDTTPDDTVTDDTTEGGDDEEEGDGGSVTIPDEKTDLDVYGLTKAYTEKYWPASGYSYTNSNVAYKITSSATGRLAHDITNTAMAAYKKDTAAEYITLATGRETSGYMNFSINVSTDNYIPTLGITYSASKLVDLINGVATDDELDSLIREFGEAGILSNSIYGYEGYNGLGAEYRSDIREAVYAQVENGGYIKFSDFIDAYDKAILFAANNVINNPSVHISFNDNTAKDVSGNNKNAEIIGNAAFIEGPDGTPALKIANEFGKTAQQYLNMGEYDFSNDNFSIVFWMKAPGRGIKYEESGDTVANGAIVDFSTYTGSSGGVVFSNKDFSVNDNTGFAFAAMPVYADFSFNMKVGEEAVSNTVGIQTAIDSRWHQISYVINRQGKASLYVDNILTKEVDISKLSGSLGVSNLVFGADGLGQYGMNKGEFDDIRIYSSALETTKIEELYYKTALNKVNNEIENLLEGANASLYLEANITALEEKLAESKAFVAGYESGNSAALIAQFNAIDEYFNVFLGKDAKATVAWGSDVHISEPSESHLNAQNLKRFLTESSEWDNPATSFILSGDLADVGADDLRYFFGFLDKWVVDGSNMIMCRGNHDEPVGSEKDTGISYTRTELKDKYVAWIDKYVNKTSPFNADVINSEGNLAQPFYYSTDGAAHYLSVDIYWPTSKSISDTQIAWLRKVLDKISGDGKPIFFVMHNPLYGTQPRVETDKNQLSKAADTKIKNLVKDYDNIFILTGHHHEGLGAGDGDPFKVKLDDGSETGVWLLNTTVLCSKNISRGYEWAGGYYINIYDDKVVFRGRDFENQKWLREYDLTFDLKPATKTVLTLNKEKTAVSVKNLPESCELILASYNGNKIIDIEIINNITENTPIVFEDEGLDTASSTEVKAILWNTLDGMLPLSESVSTLN